ncbi:hypothetical protein LPJ56_005165 [Coemansia sp. RSA 2599]|nr:hypothetical protein LPJ75_005098 [Coemansia sp. RSA 2598]KAJ1813438.1 hypothetical protein LPJ56_005165 [Coemansia sp. RSA 2599]
MSEKMIVNQNTEAVAAAEAAATADAGAEEKTREAAPAEGYQPPTMPANPEPVRFKPAGNSKLVKLAPTQYFGEHVKQSTCMACPECKADVMTVVKSEVGPQTIMASIACGFCFLPLACVMCMVDSVKDKVHYCIQCNYRFGKLQYIEKRPNAK